MGPVLIPYWKLSGDGYGNGNGDGYGRSYTSVIRDCVTVCAVADVLGIAASLCPPIAPEVLAVLPITSTEPLNQAIELTAAFNEA